MPDEQAAASAPLPILTPEPAPVAPASTADRLRAFEDKVLGKDTSRPHGGIEKGIGSPFSSLDDKHKAHHAALAALMVVEEEAQKAAALAADAEAKLDAAVKRADATEAALEAPPPEEPAPLEPLAPLPPAPKTEATVHG